MPSSLIPERPLVISPSLAATIGLEEATLLTVLSELAAHRQGQVHNGYEWHQLDEATLERHLPFWNADAIGRICASLRDKGIILLASAPYGSSLELKFALNEQQSMSSAPPPRQAPRVRESYAPNSHSAKASTIAPNWQPDDDCYALLAQQGISRDFAHSLLPEFITFWADKREIKHSWNSQFMKWAVRKWRDEEMHFAREDRKDPIKSNWQPSRDALEILTRAGINQSFIEDAVAEFVLYWRERGESSSVWNTKFIAHIRQQWARYTTAMKHDNIPRLIREDWQPDRDVFDILSLANIDHDFARRLVPEFVLYWREANQVHSSWNTKFLQHVKYHWARQLNADNDSQRRTRDISLAEQLNDRSWAL